MFKLSLLQVKAALYVARTEISAPRIVKLTAESVTFRWKDRSDGGSEKLLTIPGIEFVRRYLRHVLPHGLRSIRYYGFLHPAAVRQRERLPSGLGMAEPSPKVKLPPQQFNCPDCQTPLSL